MAQQQHAVKAAYLAVKSCILAVTFSSLLPASYLSLDSSSFALCPRSSADRPHRLLCSNRTPCRCVVVVLTQSLGERVAANAAVRTKLAPARCVRSSCMKVRRPGGSSNSAWRVLWVARLRCTTVPAVEGVVNRSQAMRWVGGRVCSVGGQSRAVGSGRDSCSRRRSRLNSLEDQDRGGMWCRVQTGSDGYRVTMSSWRSMVKTLQSATRSASATAAACWRMMKSGRRRSSQRIVNAGWWRRPRDTK